MLLVLLFHLWPEQMPGGYIGVDVFFVISGFLITAHLLGEVERTGTIRLRSFWARRVRRLLPAAYLVLLVSAVGTLLLVPRVLWQQFFGEVLASALYVENWALAVASVDYLATGNTASPVQHYWTLSAEEQFYLAWPVLMLLGVWLTGRGRARSRGSLLSTGATSGMLLTGTAAMGGATRFAGTTTTMTRPGLPALADDPTTGLVLGRRRAVRWESPTTTALLLVLSAVFALSLVYSLWVTVTDPAWTYFVTPARAWEFGAGALLVFAPAVSTFLSRLGRVLLGWVALAGLVVAAQVLDAGTPMPGTAAVWVVLAAAALIWVGAPAHPLSSARLLSLAPARFLGDISYSVYLWHWPLIVLVPYATGRTLTGEDKLAILLGTLVLAAATKYVIEDPVRAHHQVTGPRTRATFTSAAVGTVLVATLCVLPSYAVEREVLDTEQTTSALTARPPDCFGAAARATRARGCPNPALAGTIVPTPAAARTDYARFPQCVAPETVGRLQPCTFGTPRRGVPHLAVVGDSHARVLMAMLEPLVEQGRITADLYALSGCPWTATPSSRRTEAGAACADFRQQLGRRLDRAAAQYDAVATSARLSTLRGDPEERVAGLVAAWRRVTESGVPVLALRDNPQERDPAANPQLCLAEVDVGEANQRCALDRAAHLTRWYDALSVAARRTPGAHVVNLTRFYCDQLTCPVVIGGVNVYHDNNHVSATYARTLAPYVLRRIAPYL